MKNLTLVLLLSFNVTQAKDGFYDKLVKVIKDKKIKTLDDSLEGVFKLAPELKDNFALVYDSLSPVEASLEYPRTIVANYRGTFTAAWGGKKGMKNADKIEIIEYDPKLKINMFREIDFSSGTPRFGSDVRKKCVGCHGHNGNINSMRHIWDLYTSWPGVYGSSHEDRSPITGRGRGDDIPQFEKDSFRDFVKTKLALPRYKYLDFELFPQYRMFPEVGRNSSAIENFVDLSSTIQMDILAEKNIVMGAIFSERNLVRLKKRIIEAPVLMQYFWARQDRVLLREVSNYSDEWDKKLAKEIEARTKQKVKRRSDIIKKHAPDLPVGRYVSTDGIQRSGKRASYFLNKLGLEYRDVSIVFGSNPFELRSFSSQMHLSPTGEIGWFPELFPASRYEGRYYYATSAYALFRTIEDRERFKPDLSIYVPQLDFKFELNRLLKFCRTKKQFIDLISIKEEYKHLYMSYHLEDLVKFFRENKELLKNLEGDLPKKLKENLNNSYFTEEDYAFLGAL